MAVYNENVFLSTPDFTYTLSIDNDNLAPSSSFHLQRHISPVQRDNKKYNVTVLPPHLSEAHVQVLISSRAGMGLAEKFYHDVLQPVFEHLGLIHTELSDVGMEKRRGKYSHYVTENEESVKKFAREKMGLDGQGGKIQTTVVVLSGDGGVVEIINALVHDNVQEDNVIPKPDPIISLIPLGTGNALFHSLHRGVYVTPREVDRERKTHPLVHSLRTLFTGTAHPLPAFQTIFSPGTQFVIPTSKPSSEDGELEFSLRYECLQSDQMLGTIVVSTALHASLVHESDTPKMRKFGVKRFALAAQELLKAEHVYRARVSYLLESKRNEKELNGGKVEKEEWTVVQNEKHAYVLVSAVPNLEHTFTVSPASCPLEKRLHLVHFPIPKTGGKGVMDIMKAAYDGGKHVGMDFEARDGGIGKVEYVPVQAVRVVIEDDDARWRKVCVDGTILEVRKGGWFEVRAGMSSGVRILVPEEKHDGQNRI